MLTPKQKIALQSVQDGTPNIHNRTYKSLVAKGLIIYKPQKGYPSVLILTEAGQAALKGKND